MEILEDWSVDDNLTVVINIKNAELMKISDEKFTDVIGLLEKRNAPSMIEALGIIIDSLKEDLKKTTTYRYKV